MTIKNLCKNLKRKGLDAQEVTLCNLYDGSNATPAVMVYHDYEGLYPTKAACDASATATGYAHKHGFYAENRGYCQATLIYER